MLLPLKNNINYSPLSKKSLLSEGEDEISLWGKRKCCVLMEF